MENEFDFFNQLSGFDLDRSRLGGYGTFDYTAPVANTNTNTAANTNLNTGIQSIAPINMIPAPIEPFTDLGGKGGNNFTPNYQTYGKEYTGMTMPDGTPIGSMTQQEKIGILDALQNVDYKTTITNTLTNPATYLSMLNPIAGIGYRIYKANQEKKERIEKAAIEKAKKEKEMQDIIKAAEKEAAQIAEVQRQAAANKAANRGGYQAGYGSDFMGGGGRGRGMGAADKGGSDSMGSFANGGIVTL